MRYGEYLGFVKLKLTMQANEDAMVNPPP